MKATAMLFEQRDYCGVVPSYLDLVPFLTRDASIGCVDAGGAPSSACCDHVRISKCGCKLERK
jgi:hypothetical protein